MSTVINTNSEYKSNSLRNKSSFRLDGSYRIFHITKKQEESDDDDFCIKHGQSIDKENDIKTRYQKKSFRRSNRNGLDGWKRKSTKNKRLLFLHKTSCESTSNELKTSSSLNPLTNDLSSSIISDDPASSQLLKANKQTDFLKSLESVALVDTIDETITHADATLNDLLTRADQLETTVLKPEFSKIQPLTRANTNRRRKRIIIICSTVLITLTLIITIVIIVVVMKLRHRTHTNQISRSSSFYDPHQ